jgi:hypothetical protein
VCHTDLCNGDGGDNVVISNNNKEEGEGNGSSSRGSVRILFLLIGTITMVIGTILKMCWMM